MVKTNETDDRVYRVVSNDVGEYSIWLAELPIPPGWRENGPIGSRAECLEYVRVTWTDMRPASSSNEADRVAGHQKR